MAVRIKLDPVERTTQAAVFGETFDERQSAAAQFAKDGIAEADETNRRILGRIPPRTISVDGKQNGSIDNVDPDRGTVIVEYELVGDVLRWIGKTLQERSPITSGAYKRGHTLFVDGNEVPINGEIPIGEEYAFTNYVPYSRRIEVGTTKSGRSFVLQVPNRIYERTAKDAKARFGNIADIFFTYRGIVGGQQINPLTLSAPAAIVRDKRGRFASRGGVRAHNKSDVRFPTIYIRYKRS